MKLEELHDLRIILKSGVHIITKNVRHWEFSPTRYNIKWRHADDANLAHLHPEEIAAVEIIKRKKRIIWK